MRFGNREVCDLHFEKKGNGVGPQTFEIKSAKMTTIESASTTVYAQGGKGNSRLIAWEGEKTLTFTVEDALISLDTFYALTGATKTSVTIGDKQGVKFTTKTSSFAGYYSITASTFFRDEEGTDHPAQIDIPKAKLQTSLNLSMSSSGDPSTFTFTFDAFPDEQDNLFHLSILDITDDIASDDTTTIVINGKTYKTTPSTSETAISMTVATGGTITLSGTPDSDNPTLPTLKDNEVLTNFDITIAKGTAATIPLSIGSVSTWYIV